MSFFIAMSGASGAPYFTRLIERLAGINPQPMAELCISEAGKRVLWEESDLKPADIEAYPWVPERDIGARVASGSAKLEAMVIVPCSMGTLCAISAGITQNLIQRAASVQLKERRKLIIVPRETPLSLIHLRAMTQLSEAGAIILPATPGFYHKPESLRDLVDSVVDRILDHMGVSDQSIKRWGKS